MDRRKFVTILSSLAAAHHLRAPFKALAQTVPVTPVVKSGAPDLVAVANGNPADMFERGIAALGGIESFVKPGQKVLVKPNIGWDKTPEEGANTNPELVKKIIEMCLKAGASEVVCFDNTCNQMQACYTNSGIENAVTLAGGKMLPGNDQRDYRDATLEKGKILKSTQIHKAWLDCDVIINVPILKHHGGARMTAAMKNMMGVVWDRRFYHSSDLHQCIADFATHSKMPVLNVIDAYNVMMRNGPRGTGIADLANRKMMILSRDMVAADTAAARIMDLQPGDIAYIGKAVEHGVGTDKLDSIKIERLTM